MYHIIHIYYYITYHHFTSCLIHNTYVEIMHVNANEPIFNHTSCHN